MPFLEASELRRRLDRHAAWHRQELADGPLVKVSTWADPAARDRLRQKHRPPAEDYEKLVAWWTEASQVIPRVEEVLGEQVRLGDAYPHYFLNLGPGALAAFMGCRTVARPDTFWQEALIDDWATAPALRVHEDNLYWRSVQSAVL